MKLFPLPTASDRLESIALTARTTRPLVDRVGDRVVCLQGNVWITQNEDGRDIVLEPGQCFELDKPGLALVYALQDAIISVGAAEAGQAPCGSA